MHEGTAKMDYLPEERERGITITSAATTVEWKGHRINLIDTPGHVDFTVEVERSLRVLDGAVVVLDGVAGVQAQSETVWRQADRYGVPRLVFVNKLDRTGADFARVVADASERLGRRLLPLQFPWGREKAFHGVIDLVGWRALRWDEASLGREIVVSEVPGDLVEAAQHARHELLEALADEVDAFTEVYSSMRTRPRRPPSSPRCAPARWPGASCRRCAARPSATSACSRCWTRSRSCCPARTRPRPPPAATRATARRSSARATPRRRSAH